MSKLEQKYNICSIREYDYVFTSMMIFVETFMVTISAQNQLVTNIKLHKNWPAWDLSSRQLLSCPLVSFIKVGTENMNATNYCLYRFKTKIVGD